MKLLPLVSSIILATSLAVTAEPASTGTSQSSSTIPGLGAVNDPAGDCKVTGNAERLTISIPGTDHALDIEQQRMTAPRVLQEVKGDFQAQLKISGSYPHDTETQVSGRRAFQGAGLLLWVDPGTYIRLERAQIRLKIKDESKHFVYPSWELRAGGKSLRFGGGKDGLLNGTSTLFRLTRTGDKITAAVSDDGNSWRELDPFTVKLPETVQIGVVAGHNTTTPFEATFENFTLTSLSQENK